MKCGCCGQAMPDVSRPTFDLASGIFAWPSGSAELSPKESLLFCELFSRAGRVVTRDAALDAMYGEHDVPDYSYRIVTVYVSNIRRKIKTSPYRIEARTGIGYRLTLAPAT